MQVGDLWVLMGLDDKQYKKDLDRAKGLTEKQGLTLGKIFSNAFSIGIGLGLVQGFRSLGGTITDFIQTAARTEVLNVAMESVARSTGRPIAAIREHKDAVMEKGIAEQEATQILTRFMQAQLDTADAAKLARVAQDAAVISGMNSSEAAEQMTEAIAKQRPELLTAFGMTRNLNAIYKDHAVAIGKNVNQLTEAEKKQAMLNYILAEGEKIAGTYEATMGVVGKQIGSLPRYWDTLRNAIAKPLALPAVGVVVDALTNGLKNAIAWAEANALALRHWGQTAANVIQFVIRGFQGVARVFINNWSAIRFAATAFLTYAIGLQAATKATALFSVVSAALSGNLLTKIPILGTLSTAVGIYRVQMALASMQGIVLSGVLAKLRVALYATLTAIGPLGWALIGLSVAAAAAMSSWSKYSAKVQEAAQKAHMEKVAVQAEGIAETAPGAAEGQEELADAISDAGKAAGKNLQSFDEVHTLQEDMAGAAMPTLDDLDFGLGDMGDLVGFDIGDLMADMEAATPRVSEWLKEVWSNFTGWLGGVWDRVKANWETFKEWVKGWRLWSWLGEQWDSFIGWAGGLWDGVKGHWNTFKEWVKGWSLWEWIGNGWAGFISWAGGVWDGVKEGWQGFADCASRMWDGVKGHWSSFQTWADSVWETIRGTISEKWQSLKTNAGTAWESIRSTIVEKWASLQSEAPTVWKTIKSSIQERWEGLRANAPTTWEEIKSAIVTRFGEAKDEVIAFAQQLRDDPSAAWAALLGRIREKRDALYAQLTGPWEDAKKTILALVKEAQDWGRNLIDNIVTGIKKKVKDVADSIKNVADTIKDYLGFSSPTEKGPGRDADQWAPNLMKMYAKGITANMHMVQAAAGAVAKSLQGMAAVPTPAFAGMGGGGEVDRISGAAGGTAGPATEVHLHIGTLVADKQGLVRLERMLAEVRVLEEQRVGRRA